MKTATIIVLQGLACGLAVASLAALSFGTVQGLVTAATFTAACAFVWAVALPLAVW